MSTERPIGQEGTLASFVARVGKRAAQFPQDEAWKNIDLEGEVLFPSEFENGEAKAQWVTYEKRKPYWSLDVQGFKDFSPENLDAILRRHLGRIQTRLLKKGFADLELRCSWNSEDFLQEKQFPRPLCSNIHISSHIYEIKPDASNFGEGHVERHTFDAEMTTAGLVISTTGRYSRLNAELIKSLKPQLVVVRVTQKDAERIIENAKKVDNFRLAKGLTVALTPRQVLSVGFNPFFGGIGFEQTELIETVIPTRALPVIEGLLGKPLGGERRSDESRVIKLVKYLSLGQLLRGVQPETLKDIVRMLKSAPLGILYDYPTVTADQAGRFLKEELKVIENFFVDHGITGAGIALERPLMILARENLGREFVEAYLNLEDEDRLAYLISNGYKIPDEFRSAVPRTRFALRYHLFQFVKQVCLRDLEASAHKYRERYVTEKPDVRIVSEAKIDAAKAGRLDIPAKAKLFSLVLQEPKGFLNGLNEFTFYNTDPKGKNVLFRTRIGLDSPSLLSLQEQACREMGISFT